MKNILNRIFENHSLIFKLIVFLLSVISIVYLFPRGGQFKYQFQKGSVWNYDDFYAPFDFAILKSDIEVENEKSNIAKNKTFFYQKIDSISENVKIKVYEKSTLLQKDTTQPSKGLTIALKTIDAIYEIGVIDNTAVKNVEINDNGVIQILEGNTTKPVYSNQFFTIDTVKSYIINAFLGFPDSNEKQVWVNFLQQSVQPNLVLNKKFTENYYQNQLNNVFPLKGFVEKGSLIITKNQIIEQNEFEKLTSINREYDVQTWSGKNYFWLIVSYIIIVSITLLMLILFINQYRKGVGENISKLTFLFVNIFLMVLATRIMLQYNANYLYLIPYTLLPLLIKAFLDPRLGLFTHVLTVLLLGFIVPNGFEFIFIQIIAGIVTILTVSELNKRANIFLSVAKITSVYIITYFAITVTHEGNAANVDKFNIYLFIINGLLTASLIIPLIFLYEKLFGLISDETLREFSDTNHKLLKELNEKAPGTFQHSMQVANLAEDACKEIGANALLARTGALYHDIGKLNNPLYFVENQSTGANPHAELDPEESARIIIDHVVLGIEIAKKHNLPDKLIDFIRTHHGTNLVYYFYKKEEEYNADATDINKFRYPGPLPFSKETAVVMICDACEAASKSLKEPTAKTLDTFVDKIVKNQMENAQFQNADITFREIERVKKVVKKKLKNIHHLRIEYPE